MTALLYRWPQAAKFGRAVPKTKFYEHATIGLAIKDKFVSDVRRITWAYKLAESTINLPGSAAVLGLSAKAGALRITYTENGGIAALLTHSAQQAGMEEEAFTEQLKEQVGMMVGQFIQDKALANRITEAVGEFLDDPTSLSIAATPKGDVPLAALAVALRGSPFAMLPMFNIEITANQ